MVVFYTHYHLICRPGWLAIRQRVFVLFRPPGLGAARMANERPLNLVQLLVVYFDAGTSIKCCIAVDHL